MMRPQRSAGAVLEGGDHVVGESSATGRVFWLGQSRGAGETVDHNTEVIEVVGCTAVPQFLHMMRL